MQADRDVTAERNTRLFMEQVKTRGAANKRAEMEPWVTTERAATVPPVVMLVSCLLTRLPSLRRRCPFIIVSELARKKLNFS